MNRHLHYDVFTNEHFSGNQLAVFPDGTGLDAATMQRIANEMNFSESTFILPPEHHDTDVRMRIFTPTAELPMAGHPTVGSTFALAHEGRSESGTEQFVFGLGIGPTPVELEWQGDRLAFAWMVQPVPEFGTILEDRAALARGLGLAASDLSDSLPAQIVSAGVEFLLVPLASRTAVDSITFNRSSLQGLFEAAGSPERGVVTFAPEPACGDGPGAHTRMVSIQGAKMGRPSRITISLATAEDSIQRVRVGGEAVLAGEGSLAS